MQLVSAEVEQEVIFPLKGCCLQWLCEYSHQAEVYIYDTRLLDTGTAVQSQLATTNATIHALSDVLPMGRRLPLPFPPNSPSVCIGRVEAEDGETVPSMYKCTEIHITYSSSFIFMYIYICYVHEFL